MTLRGPDPESYITEYTSVYEYSTRIRGHRWGAVGEGGRATGRPTLEHTQFHTYIHRFTLEYTRFTRQHTPLTLFLLFLITSKPKAQWYTRL